MCVSHCSRLTNHLPPSHPTTTEGKPLTAPKTNLEITDPTYAMLFPNVMARSQVLEYKEAKTREWEAAERAWQQKQAQEQEA